MRRPILNFAAEGSGPDVVLIHGVGANLASWDGFLAAYGAGARFIRMDLRGHGQSAPIREPFSVEAFAADIIALMDHLAVARAHIVGFSLGGMIAQCLALDWPDRVDRLGILSAVAARTDEERAKVIGRLDAIRTGGIRAVTTAARERWFTDAFAAAHPERIEARIAELVANDHDSYLEAYRVFGESEFGHRLHAIRHRTLVLTGEHDAGSNTRMARYMHQQIANSALVILPGLKHSILVEAPDLVADHVRHFLNAP